MKKLITFLMALCLIIGFGSNNVQGIAKDSINKCETVQSTTIKSLKTASKNKSKFLLDLEKYLSKKVAKKVQNVLKKKIGFTKLEFVQQLGETDNYQVRANGHDIVVTVSNKLYRIFTPYECTWYENGKVKKKYK